MPAQKPQWFFQPRSHRNGAGTGDGDTAAGLTTVPAAVLRRHGARVLDPEKAAAVHGFPSPRSTVYRARTLLVPGGLLQHAPKVRAINEILDDVGMTLIPSRPEAPPRVRRPRTGPQAGAASPGRDAGPGPRQTRARGGRCLGRPPDAARGGDAIGEQEDRRNHRWTRTTSSRSRWSTCWSVRPSTAARPATPAAASPPTRTAAAASPGRAAPTRTSTAAATRAARSRSCSTRRTAGRRPSARTTTDGGPWSPCWTRASGLIRGWMSDGTSGSYDLDPAGTGDGFMSVDLGIQKAILDEGKKAEAKGDKPRQLIRHPWDTPITADPLVGELDSDSGHGTFISGIVRQIAPDARVLAVRIMHSDGAVYEGDLLCALRHLVIRIAHAQAGRPGADGRRDLAVARLLRRDPARRDVHLRALGRHRAAARPGCHRGGGGRELLDQPQVLPRGVRHEDAARGACR